MGAFRKGMLARIKDGEVVAEYRFQFNPTQVGHSRAVSHDFATPGGGYLPLAQFLYVNGDTFSISLLLDATDEYSHAKQGTRAQKACIELLTHPDVDDFLSGVGQFNPTPQVRFEVGGVSWNVKIVSLNMKDVRWNNELIETRTTVDIEMQSIYTSAAEMKARMQRLAALRAMVEEKVKR